MTICPTCGILPRKAVIAWLVLGLALGLAAGLELGALRWKVRGDRGNEWKSLQAETAKVRDQCLETLSFKTAHPEWKSAAVRDGK